jgi:adenylate cyclase
MGDSAAPALPDDFRLGPFEVSPELRLIRGARRETRIEPKAMAVLEALAEAAPSPVSRDELLQRVWGHQVVGEEVLTRCVHQLRRALGDNPRHPDLLETIPRQGYRLRVAPEPLLAAASDSSTPGASPPPASLAPHRSRRALGGLIAVALIVGVLVWGYLHRIDRAGGSDAAAVIDRPVTDAAGPPERSLAVLPCTDLSPDKDHEYFADGLAEELLSLLTQVPEILVTSRTSSFYFKDKDVTLREVAKILNVRYVIECSVRKSGDLVRVTVQLIEAAPDAHIWSESWDRELKDIFDIHQEIAARVVKELKVAIVGSPPTVAETDPEAYNLYLRARFLARATTPETMAAVDLYEQALAIDPGYAPAWNGLSALYFRLVQANMLPWHEGWSMARAAAENALAADPHNARAYALLGAIAGRYDVDFEAAAGYLQEAYRLSQDEEVLTPVAEMLRDLGRTEDSIQIETDLMQRDHMNPKHYLNLGIKYYVIEDFESAEKMFDNAISLNPNDADARLWDAAVSCKRGRYQQCLDDFEALANQIGDESWALVGRSLALHRMGREEEAAQALTTLERDFAGDKGFVIALIHATQGRSDKALEWLQRQFDLVGPSGISTAPYHPEFKTLRDNPRYQALLEQAGVSEAQLAAVEFEIDLPN